MVKHRLNGSEWWCLPGGGIEGEETPEMAALRELREECNVEGRLIKRTSVVEYGPDDHHFPLAGVGLGMRSPIIRSAGSFRHHRQTAWKKHREVFPRTEGMKTHLKMDFLATQ